MPTPTDLPFHLQDNEKIIKIVRPNPKLFWRLWLGPLITAMVFVVLFGTFAGVFFYYGNPGGAGTIFASFLAIMLIIVLVVGGISARLATRRYLYWITDRRTVGRRGVVGFTIDSMPYENIADVIVSRQVADRVFGLSSLYIQPFGGAGFVAPQGTGRYSGSNMFLGLLPPQAVELQKLIFHMRELRRVTPTWGR